MSEPGSNHRRRAPLRFVWQMDAEHRFTVGSDEFAALMGQATAAALGRPWPELTAALSLDPEGQVALALASRDTWSGLCIAWPAEDGCERLMVELSGLPVFDRERVFRGFFRTRKPPRVQVADRVTQRGVRLRDPRARTIGGHALRQRSRRQPAAR